MECEQMFRNMEYVYEVYKEKALPKLPKIFMSPNPV